MSLIKPPRLAPQGGKHGLTASEKPDAIGLAVAALNKLASNPALDRFGLRKPAERVVYEATKSGFKAIGTASRTFERRGKKSGSAKRPASAASTGVFDLTPTEDEQMLVDVVTEFATEVVRPAAHDADAACEAPVDLLKASLEIGLPILGVPEELGGISAERSAMAGTLVAEALAKGDMGLAVAALAPGAVATAISLWGTDEQQQTYLPSFTDNNVPAAALALGESRPLFDPLAPQTTAKRSGDGFVLNGTKTQVVRAVEDELFVVGALLDGKPQLFIVESGAEGITIESDPSMGLRAANLGALHLKDVKVGAIGLLGDEESYVECVRLSRLAWCALSLGTAQAVLDYVIPYVNGRIAFGEPISHRQAVAFMVADIAIELEGMRLVTYRAASRATQGKSFAREVALARKICAEKGMKIGNDGVQLLGGHGFVKEHPVERWYRDLRAIGLMEGAVLV
jgi:alkylation response protein AidB-like acyl-CoA dehydrogenase